MKKENNQKKHKIKDLYKPGQKLILSVENGKKENQRISRTQEGILCFYDEDSDYIPPKVGSVVKFKIKEVRTNHLLLTPIEIVTDAETVMANKLNDLKQLIGKFKISNL